MLKRIQLQFGEKLTVQVGFQDISNLDSSVDTDERLRIDTNLQMDLHWLFRELDHCKRVRLHLESNSYWMCQFACASRRFH